MSTHEYPVLSATPHKPYSGYTMPCSACLAPTCGRSRPKGILRYLEYPSVPCEYPVSTMMCHAQHARAQSTASPSLPGAARPRADGKADMPTIHM
jgi:hypothetical protein